PQEVASVEKALELAKQNKLTGIEKHIEAAVSKLADRKNPDYRNSIKESISAVEAIVNRICGTEASLGDALKTLDKKLTLHGALKSGFSSIYGYTSDPKTGIRHFMLDEPNIGQEDAIFMLISCSAFINYLMIKCQKANIKLQ
ncbi:MAG: hypothetical protein NT051_03680, partial [Candidatus Micrarchaeota archaeon]|nr:hypothetical protein [Candidatus Micrarchaeota archaeon]